MTTAMPWDPSLETGNARIDSQHQTLFSLVGELRDASLAENTHTAVGDVLGKLSDYANSHFAEEQQLMISSGYPADAMLDHVRQHTLLKMRAAEVVQQHRQRELVTVLPVAEFLFDWLREHIGKSDRALVQHLRSQAAGA